MPSRKTTLPLEPEKYYHIYNRANNGLLFYGEMDYLFFLQLYRNHVMEVVDLYAYALMPSHFHLLIKPKSLPGIAPSIISERMRRLFLIYSANYNAIHKKRGNLFHRPFRRVEVPTLEYLKYLLFYIHYNPVKDRLAKKFRDYTYCSYQDYCNGTWTLVNTRELMSMFNHSVKEFEAFHMQLLEL